MPSLFSEQPGLSILLTSIPARHLGNTSCAASGGTTVRSRPSSASRHSLRLTLWRVPWQPLCRQLLHFSSAKGFKRSSGRRLVRTDCIYEPHTAYIWYGVSEREGHVIRGDTGFHESIMCDVSYTSTYMWSFPPVLPIGYLYWHWSEVSVLVRFLFSLSLGKITFLPIAFRVFHKGSTSPAAALTLPTTYPSTLQGQTGGVGFIGYSCRDL